MVKWQFQRCKKYIKIPWLPRMTFLPKSRPIYWAVSVVSPNTTKQQRIAPRVRCLGLSRQLLLRIQGTQVGHNDVKLFSTIFNVYMLHMLHMNAYYECIWYQYQYTNVYNRQLIFVLMCPTFSRSCLTRKHYLGDIHDLRTPHNRRSSLFFWVPWPLDMFKLHNVGRSQSSVNSVARHDMTWHDDVRWSPSRSVRIFSSESNGSPSKMWSSLAAHWLSLCSSCQDQEIKVHRADRNAASSMVLSHCSQPRFVSMPRPEVLDPMHWYELRPAHEQSIEPFQAWPVLKRMSRIDDEMVIK